MTTRTSPALMLPLLLVAGLMACGYDEMIVATGELSTGTWGGQNAGVIVDDVNAHVHIGCTNGNFPVPVDPDDEGKFSVPGEYVLRAYPIQIGPSLPAQFAGHLSGRRLTLTVAVNDTVEKKLVILGPVQVTLGIEPRLGPCPICRMPPRRDAVLAAGRRYRLPLDQFHFFQVETALPEPARPMPLWPSEDGRRRGAGTHARDIARFTPERAGGI